MKLTPEQRRVIELLQKRPTSANGMGCSLSTLNALFLKGLVRLTPDADMNDPRKALWSLTETEGD